MSSEKFATHHADDGKNLSEYNEGPVVRILVDRRCEWPSTQTKICPSPLSLPELVERPSASVRFSAGLGTTDLPDLKRTRPRRILYRSRPSTSFHSAEFCAESD